MPKNCLKNYKFKLGNFKNLVLLVVVLYADIVYIQYKI